MHLRAGIVRGHAGEQRPGKAQFRLTELKAIADCAAPHHTSPYLTSPHRTQPHRIKISRRLGSSQHYAVPHLTVPYRTSPYLTLPDLTKISCCIRDQPCRASAKVAAMRRRELQKADTPSSNIQEALYGLWFQNLLVVF